MRCKRKCPICAYYLSGCMGYFEKAGRKDLRERLDSGLIPLSEVSVIKEYLSNGRLPKRNIDVREHLGVR